MISSHCYPLVNTTKNFYPLCVFNDSPISSAVFFVYFPFFFKAFFAFLSCFTSCFVIISPLCHFYLHLIPLLFVSPQAVVSLNIVLPPLWQRICVCSWMCPLPCKIYSACTPGVFGRLCFQTSLFVTFELFISS